MPRPKASNWQPVGLDDDPIPGLYPDGLLDELIRKHLHVENDAHKKKMRKGLRDILSVLWFGLHYRSRPTGGSKKTAIGKAEEALKLAVEALNALDADSRRLLEAQAEVGDDERFDNFVRPYDRYWVALQSLSALREWVGKGRATIRDSDRGRTEEIDERTAIVRCRNLMTSALRREPTREELQSFVDDLFTPFRTELGLLAGALTGHVNQALYGLE